MVEGYLVGSVRVRLEDPLDVGALGSTSSIEFVERDVIDLDFATPGAVCFDLVDRTSGCRGNVQVLACDIVSKHHEAHLLRAVAIVALWAVQCLCLAIDLRVEELDLVIISFTSSLQTHTLL